MENITQGQWFGGPKADLGDTIDYSLRFRATGLVGSGTPYISRNFAGASSTTSTLSYWWKRGTEDYPYKLHWQNPTFQVYLGNGSSHQDVYYGNLEIGGASGKRFRDSSAWYHTFIQMNGGSAPRIWINGVEETITNGPSSCALFVNGTNIYGQATNPGSSSWSANNYLAEVYHVDGTSLPVTDFGRFNEDGVWVPVAPTISSWGTNGFHLTFDSSQTNGAGHDSSGQGNHWTLNGHETTAISSSNFDNDIDYLDTPTSNYATFNPLVNPGFGANHDSGITRATISDTNLRATGSQNNYPAVVMSTMTNDKVYFEFTSDGNDTNRPGLALCNINYTNNSRSSSSLLEVFRTGGVAANGGTGLSTGTFPTWGANDVVRVTYDNTTHELSIAVNGGSFTTVDLDNITGGYVVPDYYSFGLSLNDVGHYGYINFGQRPFVYSVPAGFKALQTNNLTEPTIKKGKDHFDIALWSGNGTNRSITGLNFQPDLVWIKCRDTTYNHNLVDSVRGSDKIIYPDLGDAEVTAANVLTSFNSDGFSLSNSASSNNNGNDYVAWCWKAGGTAVSNTDGTLTSSVSANPKAGFSVVSYTGNNSQNQTIGHGLNQAPEMIIVKNRTDVANWIVYNHNLVPANDEYLMLHEADGSQGGGGSTWAGTAPTNSVFSVGSGFNNTNGNGDNMIAYCWHGVEGYSKFGEYTGNGLSLGPFVYLGFKPAFLMVKAYSHIGSWIILDTERFPNNQNETAFKADTDAAEAADFNYTTDFLSNGFRIRNNGHTNVNANSYKYIYMAFAENPFGGKNTAPATAR